MPRPSEHDMMTATPTVTPAEISPRARNQYKLNLEGKVSMNVEITGRHVLITAAIRTYVLKRLRKLAKILGDGISFHVIVGVEKDRHSAEILLKSKMLDLTGTGETKDMYSSIMLAVEKLEKQALKQKSKLIETKRHQAKAQALAKKSGVPRISTARLNSDEVQTVPLAGRRNGILEEEAQRKPMVIEEAVLELGHSAYPFVVFRNAESGAVNVLYRRKDGFLGLIQA